MGVLGAFLKSASSSDIAINRNSAGTIEFNNNVAIIIFMGHSTLALPAIILINNSTYSVIGSLGAISVYINSDNDMNNIIDDGWYYIINANAPSNCPSWGGKNSVVYVHRFANSFVLQVMADANTLKMGYRIGLSASISGSWKELTTA